MPSVLTTVLMCIISKRLQFLFLLSRQDRIPASAKVVTNSDTELCNINGGQIKLDICNWLLGYEVA